MRRDKGQLDCKFWKLNWNLLWKLDWSMTFLFKLGRQLIQAVKNTVRQIKNCFQFMLSNLIKKILPEFGPQFDQKSQNFFKKYCWALWPTFRFYVFVFLGCFGCFWNLFLEISTFVKASLCLNVFLFKLMVFVFWCVCWNILQIKFVFTSLTEFNFLFPQFCTRIVLHVWILMFDIIWNKSFYTVKRNIFIRTKEGCNTFELKTRK